MRLRLYGWHAIACLRSAVVLGLLVGCSTVGMAAELQECDPVSAHPEGKIICRPFGPSAKPPASSPPAASSNALQQIEQLIAQHGKPTIIAFIRTKRDGQITLAVGTGFRTFYGSPNVAYVTPQTILMQYHKSRPVSPTCWNAADWGLASKCLFCMLLHC